MAIRAAAASGNWGTAGTWGLVDQSSTTGTSYLNSESGTDLLTTLYSDTLGAAFSWSSGAPTIDGIGIRIANLTGITGTISVHLEVANVEVGGTAVTINLSDLGAALSIDSTSINGGWLFFKFATPVALSNSTSYKVAAKTSSTNQVNIYRDGTTDNLCHYLRTTTTGAPAAGDDVIIAGEYISAGSSNILTVTMDQVAGAITDYGANNTTTQTVNPAIFICSKGILKYGSTAATNYYLRVSGNIIIYSGGEFDIGTVATPIPRGSTAILNFDCGTNVDFGLIVRNLGKFVSQGLSRTSGKNIYYCKLNVDSPANDLVLDVDTDTGWLDNDEIAVASTTRTSGQCEKGTINVTVTSTQITVDGFGGTSGGLLYAHSGSSPTQAEVILLTRNVQIFGASGTLQAYVDIRDTSIVDCDWTEFKWLGSGTALKVGINTSCTTGIQSFQYCSRHSSTVTGSQGWNCTGTSGSGLTISNNVTFNLASNHFGNVASSGTMVVDGNIFMLNTDNAIMAVLGDVGGTFTNNSMIGATANAAWYIGDNGGTIGTILNNVVHSGGSTGLNFPTSAVTIGTITNTTIWRQAGNGLLLAACEIYFDTLTMFGNSTNIAFNGVGGFYRGNNWTINGDATFGTGTGINMSNTGGTFILNSCDFGVAAGSGANARTAHTQDINLSVFSFARIVLINTNLASGTEVAGQANMLPSCYISSQRHDKTTGNNKTWKRNGTLSIETTTVHTGSQALKMTPINASSKLESNSFFVAVASGTTLTPTVYVREDASYVSSRARLILKRNDSIGITSDTVIDTATAASDGAWEALTGTTPVASEDGVMEFVVDCDGTAGNLFVDTFSVV